MTRHIHFCNVGREPEPPLAVCRTPYPKDRVYLVNSPPEPGDVYTENEAEVRRRLEDVGITDIRTVHADPYDFEAVTEAVESAISAEKEEGDCRFHFNITAGTNISAGAMTAIALSMKDADIYHLCKGEFMRPPSEEDHLRMVELADMESVRMLEEKPKEAELMRIVSEGGTIAHKDLLERAGMSPSLLSYHLKMLSQQGLIERTGGNAKSPDWTLTGKGEKVWRRCTLRNPRMRFKEDYRRGFYRESCHCRLPQPSRRLSASAPAPTGRS